MCVCVYVWLSLIPFLESKFIGWQVRRGPGGIWDHPPLPEGWVLKHSRRDRGQIYYVKVRGVISIK